MLEGMIRRQSILEYEAFIRAVAKTVKPGTTFAEEEHVYACQQCGQGVDRRNLGQVFHHELPGHQPLPEN